MEDRLLDIKKGLATVMISDTESDFSPQFTGKVKFIQQALGTVKGNLEEIGRLKEQHQTATKSDEEKRISSALNKILEDNQKICEKIKDQLKTLNDQIEQNKQLDGEQEQPETRFMKVTYKTLSTEFSDTLKRSQTIQVEFKSAVKAKMARQAKILDENLTDDEVQDVVNDPEGLSKLMQGKLIGPGHVKLQNAVADIQDKYKDIQRLEASVAVIYQMFVDMAMLVHAQGEIINSIEENCNQTKGFVTKAEKKLAEARTSHQAYKKKMCCLMIVLLVIIAAVLQFSGHGI
jgi:t-SNARE complex subunit (syntaxin)